VVCSLTYADDDAAIDRFAEVLASLPPGVPTVLPGERFNAAVVRYPRSGQASGWSPHPIDARPNSRHILGSWVVVPSGLPGHCHDLMISDGVIERRQRRAAKMAVRGATAIAATDPS
jgi:hypothetical protein